MNEGSQHENSNNLGKRTPVDLSHDCEAVAADGKAPQGIDDARSGRGMFQAISFIMELVNVVRVLRSMFFEFSHPACSARRNILSPTIPNITGTTQNITAKLLLRIREAHRMIA